MKIAWKKFVKERLGPGLVTGASDDDPSGILTYLQSGVILGATSLWTALVTFPLMYGVQTLAAKLGFVTEKGIARLIKENFPSYVLYPVALVSVVVISINIGADLLAIGVVLEKLTPLDRLFWMPVVAISILYFTIFLSYKRIASVLKWLAFSLLFYIAVSFAIHTNWTLMLKSTLIPSIRWSEEGILLLAAIFGTTISPYLFFWQANEEAEEHADHQKPLSRIIVTKHELRVIENDTWSGMLLSNLTMWFIIVAATGLVTNYSLKEIQSFDQAALSLRPILGELAYFVFSLGIIGTGLLAIPVLAGSVGYILAEVFNWQEGMNKSFREAKGFYLSITMSTLAGVALVFLGFDPVTLLIYTGAFYTLITPPLILIIISLAKNKKVMGNHIPRRGVFVLAYGAFALMTLAAIAFVMFAIF